MWCTSEECGEVIANSWNANQTHSPQVALVEKLRSCKEVLKHWSKRTFGNNLEKIRGLKLQLGEIQGKLYSVENFQKENQIREELELTLLREEMYQHQRSRLNWITYGDKNTAFFHATVIQRRQRNQLTRLKNNEGVWLSEDHEINEHLSEYFSKLFTATGSRDFEEVLHKVDKCVTDDMNCKLTRRVSDEEIKEAVFQLGALKTPGPDGFPGLFFQKFWGTVGEDVNEAVKRFFSDGFLFEELNETNMVLIPKVQSPESLSQLRPISLCNFCLKIITKILANRLKGILKFLISPNQSAFVPGRLIQDNIIIAHEAFHFLHRKKKGKDGFMAIKLDFNKAYDRVEWDFLRALMDKMGFATEWIRWTMECVSTVQFVIKANGEARANVSPRRGLRQGDPLSPYLFLLVKDVLSKLIQVELNNKHLSGMRINRHCPILSHILFADDALLFLKADLKDCCIVLDILKKYGEASGQLINYEKSGVFCSSNMCDIDKQLCCDLLNMSPMKGDSKYLGLPSFWGRSKAEAYTFLVERAFKKMQGWKTKLISMAGKETLIKSQVQGIPTYTMACFLLPKRLCDKLDSITRNFWWKGNPEDRGICWNSWESLTTAKSQGGMGFRNYRCFNEAMLARQGWRLLMNPHSYWGRILKGIYFPNSTFLQASRGSHASWAWASLLHGRNLLTKGLRWQIQNGKNTDFWNDPWIPTLPNFRIPIHRPQGSQVRMVADVIDSRNGTWNSQKLGREVPPEVVEAILKIPLPLVDRQDQVVWHYDQKGVYSVKSGYQVAMQSNLSLRNEKAESSFKPKKVLWKVLWKMKVQGKIKSFWWRACKNSLATCENLFRRKCAQSSACPICGSEIETVEHMLFWCSWAKAIWFVCNIKVCGDLGGNASVLKWADDMVDKMTVPEATEYMGFVALVAWHIWKTRNGFVFRKIRIDPRDTLAAINHARMETSWILEIPDVHMDTPSPQEDISTWRAPDRGHFKANCDVAIPKGGGEGKLAVVIRDWKGKILDGLTRTTVASSTLSGELRAIRAACAMVTCLGIRGVEVEADNKQAILLSVSELVPPWEVSSEVLDIRHFAKEWDIKFRWVRRGANRVAHEIAALAKKNILPCNWFNFPPLSLFSILCNEEPM
ncbi:hypothetical protein RHMOL_Rhmol13G0231200 [Rhododendron molle]|uniref:Uncharacterized protein n=1 Tax=Rhododendron molle TaxID=49168 RepID=A0ACC0LAS4_RHOML|nr:hypothetical protein RHMOL_Rhmol13G0231200 [Rhododendron molle]